MPGASRCPYCDETLGPGGLPPGCPYSGSCSCPLFPEANQATVDPSTIDHPTEPWPGADAGPPGSAIGRASGPRDLDGFPEVDDLIDRMLGQYRMGAVIGQGSMGRVYRALHSGLGRNCAIKVMKPALVDSHPKVLDRFWAEARALAGLLHPHIVTVHNLGSDRGYHYIEMEYVPGGLSLGEALIREGPMAPLRASTLVRQVVDALGAAHAAGLAHGDVKPANVLLTADGRAKLADFGLVRDSVEEVAGAPIAGTPAFMAPELFGGAPASARSDFYAVGVMLFYLLSARLPFSADRIRALIGSHRHAEMPDVRRFAPETPTALVTILRRCLAKRPSDRYAEAHELANDLQSAIFDLRDVEALIREALEGLEGEIRGEGEAWRIGLRFPDGRRQEVRVEVACGRSGVRLLSVFSVCCPADPDHYEFALRLNEELTFGGLSIHDVEGRPMFVMRRTYAGEDVSPGAVRSAVLAIARRSDQIEHQLTQADHF